MTATEMLAGIPAPDPDAAARLHARLVEEADGEGLLDVSYRTLDSPVGPLLLAATTDGLVRVAFDREDHDAVLATLAAEISPRILRAPRRLDDAARQLDEYFARRRRRFDLPVDLQLAHGFRRTVLTHLRGDPVRRDGDLRHGCRGDREAGGGAGGRNRVRAEPAPARRAVPPGRAQRRDARPVRRRTRGQGAAAADGGGGMTFGGPGVGATSGSTAWTGRRSPPGSTTSGVRRPVPSCPPTSAATLADLYDEDARFRSTIDMARYRFGEGEYRYFDHPLPDAGHRAAGGVLAAPPADRPGVGRQARPARRRGPTTFDDWLAAVPRRRPAAPDPPAAALPTGRLERAPPRPLRRPGLPAPGGRRPRRAGRRLHRRRVPRRRAASPGPVPRDGDRSSARAHALVFTTRDRPVRSTRGWSAAPMRHGVSVLRSGHRLTLGLVFHDAA